MFSMALILSGLIFRIPMAAKFTEGIVEQIFIIQNLEAA